MTTATFPAPLPTVPTAARRPAATPPPHPEPAAVTLFRFTVAQYDAMVRAGVLSETDRVELLDGFVVTTMPPSDEHAATVMMLGDAIRAALPAGWAVRTEQPIALSTSSPQPDVAVVRGQQRDYFRRRPGPADIALVVEAALSSLDLDRTTKLGIYAGDGVPAYWVIDIAAGTVEAWGDPTAGAYRDHRVFRTGETIPLAVGGSVVGAVSVADLLGPPA